MDTTGHKLVYGGIVTGTFYITGDYKMNEGSINREKFSFDLPFDITLDPRYDVNSVKADIEDFYYDVINEDTLKVNIDLYIEAEYLPDTSLDNNILTEEDKSNNEMNDVQKEDEPVEEDRNIMTESKSDSKNDENIEIEKDKEVTSEKINNDDATMNDSDIERNDVDDFANDLFSNLDNTETYTTYYVYIVKEEDTIDKIISLYGVTKEDIENYNDITSIKPGDKVIIPKTSE